MCNTANTVIALLALTAGALVTLGSASSAPHRLGIDGLGTGQCPPGAYPHEAVGCIRCPQACRDPPPPSPLTSNHTDSQFFAILCDRLRKCGFCWPANATPPSAAEPECHLRRPLDDTDSSRKNSQHPSWQSDSGHRLFSRPLFLIMTIVCLCVAAGALACCIARLVPDCARGGSVRPPYAQLSDSRKLPV